MKKILYSSVSIALLANIANAFDYNVGGTAQTFTKVGFNNQSYNSSTGAAPTESFTTIFAQLNLNADLGSGFRFGLGGSIGGLAFDSTRNNIIAGQEFSAVQTSYYGYAYDKNTMQNYMIQNAFLEYLYNDRIYFRLGRYESGTAGANHNQKVGEYFSGYTQGAEGYIRLGITRIWGFWSNRRGFAYDEFFNDFYRVHGVDKNGNGRQTYAAGIDFNTTKFTASLFSYGVTGKVVAPGISLTYDTNPDFAFRGLRSITKIRTIVPMALGLEGEFWGESASVRQNQWRGIEKTTATLYIEQKFDLSKFNFGAGYYQNFGNANAHIGTWGNPLLSTIDIWTASAYDIGQALSDIVGKDAITGYGFVGGDYNVFHWKIIARGTKSERSDEQSVGLSLNYRIRDDLFIGGKIEWFSDTTKAGYSPIAGYAGENAGVLSKNRTDDRSHAFFYIHHHF
ncbi:outer membrane family protein [Helicobacter sp. MIT 05-5293]|uniref:outer membrane family protein n=1 Tax=Helicobacter sp. MIT 05-5293 TaxID=1548149 RepID=UPI00051DA18B|nr:outer membrane family protein [Helicobacter sp. MIT 05-5293]TLD80096.1 outer membrane family protein [Helicobacter sp. MIT 05-5293]